MQGHFRLFQTSFQLIKAIFRMFDLFLPPFPQTFIKMFLLNHSLLQDTFEIDLLLLSGESTFSTRILIGIQCTLCTVHHTLHTLQCTLYTLNSTIYTKNFALYINNSTHHIIPNINKWLLVYSSSSTDIPVHAVNYAHICVGTSYTLNSCLWIWPRILFCFILDWFQESIFERPGVAGAVLHRAT